MTDLEDSENGRPVVGADEVIQIGGMLLAKNVKYGNTGDFKTKFKGKNISFSKRLKKLQMKWPATLISRTGSKNQNRK